MKKMAKRFFSSVIVLAMLMALLPASIVNAAVIDSRDFETEAGITGFTKGTYGGSIHTWDNTVSYNGQASMKVEESSSYALVGLSKSGYKYDTTYRISARIKFADNNTDSKKVIFETWGANTVGPTTNMYWDGSGSPAYDHNSDDTLRTRSDETIITDGEWHLVSSEFKFSKKDGATATQVDNMTIGIATLDSQDTYWLDDFSIVEIASVDNNLKNNFMAFKSFEGVSTEVAEVKDWKSRLTANITRTTEEAYEGIASAKVENLIGGTVMDIGTYDFEVGQYYRISAYIKSDFPEGSDTTGYLKFELNNINGEQTGVISAKSKLDGYNGARPGFGLGYPNDEQYPNNSYGFTRFGGAPIKATDDGYWLRHDRIFTVNSTDANITSTPLKLTMWTNVPEGTILYVDNVKLEKLGIDGNHKGISNYGGTLLISGENCTPESGIATGFKFIASADYDDHTPNMVWNMEHGKKYRASVKVFVPSSNKAAVDAFAETWKESYPAAAEPKITFGSTSVDLVYDQWVTLSYDIDWTAKASGVERIGINGIVVRNQSGGGSNYRTVKETFYFGDYNVVELKSESAAAAGLPDISFATGTWKNYCETIVDVGTIDGIIAKKATKAASYTYPFVQTDELVVGKDYMASIKYYIPEDQWKDNTELKLFLIDNADDSGIANTADANNSAVLHKTIVNVTEDMTNKWIEVQLPFTHKAAATDTDGLYQFHVCTAGLGKDNYYYFADPQFIDINKANIENLEISANGTVTYTANEADYFLNYEYLDGTTVLERGMVLAGEFLPKFNLAGVEEPTVKLTAMNAYGVAEETVVGVKAKEETPDIGGDEEDGTVAVNSVEIIAADNEDGVAAESVAELDNGMYIRINYNNSTEEAKPAWLMVAFYNADGLISANKYPISLVVPESEGAADIEYPEYPGIIDNVEGSTIVKAFVWDVDSVEPLCAGYVVD